MSLAPLLIKLSNNKNNNNEYVGSKFTVSTTNILLMTIAILLFCMILEQSEKPKAVRLVDKKSKSSSSKDD